LAAASEAAFRAADKNGEERCRSPKHTDARMKDYKAADANEDDALTRDETEAK